MTVRFLAGQDKLGAWDLELKAASLETAKLILNEVYEK